MPHLRGTEEAFRPAAGDRLRVRTADLESLVRGMYVRGLLTQDVSALYGHTCGASRLVSKSTVSRVTQQLNQEFDTWRCRDLSELPVVYLFLDGPYHAARQGTDGAVRRARVILLTAAGARGIDIAVQRSPSPASVSRIRRRFAEAGVDGLRDRPKAGRRDHAVPADTVQQVLQLALSPPPAGRSRWTTRLLGQAVGRTRGCVSDPLRAHGLKPHLVRTYKVSRDPACAAKVTDVVGLYLQPPEHAIVLSMRRPDKDRQIDSCSQEHHGSLDVDGWYRCVWDICEWCTREQTPLMGGLYACHDRQGNHRAFTPVKVVRDGAAATTWVSRRHASGRRGSGSDGPAES